MEVKSLIGSEFWKNKRVFLTGHTGFKGSWLALWLKSMGAIVKGYALEPATKPNLFDIAQVAQDMDSQIGDIRELETLQESMKSFNPDILIHMAAQPLVRYSYDEPVETYSTNVMGTVNVLESARNCPNLKAIINVTTDKCYENKEWVWGYRENEPMGGHDPYSSSKGCAELVTSAYQRSFFHQDSTPNLASVRAGNVIGGGDWADDRLIPDILRAFEKNKPVIIRNPHATRPWQHVLEPLSGYLILAENLYERGDDFAEGWNFGPDDEDVKPVSWILDHMVKEWGQDARWQLDENNHPHESGYLKLDCSKARVRLNWTPTWQLSKTLNKIILWQHAWKQGDNMQVHCLNEIQEYTQTMNRKYHDS